MRVKKKKLARKSQAGPDFRIRAGPDPPRIRVPEPRSDRKMALKKKLPTRFRSNFTRILVFLPTTQWECYLRNDLSRQTFGLYLSPPHMGRAQVETQYYWRGVVSRYSRFKLRGSRIFSATLFGPLQVPRSVPNVLWNFSKRSPKRKYRNFFFLWSCDPERVHRFLGLVGDFGNRVATKHRKLKGKKPPL